MEGCKGQWTRLCGWEKKKKKKMKRGLSHSYLQIQKRGLGLGLWLKNTCCLIEKKAKLLLASKDTTQTLCFMKRSRAPSLGMRALEEQIKGLEAELRNERHEKQWIRERYSDYQRKLQQIDERYRTLVMATHSTLYLAQWTRYPPGSVSWPFFLARAWAMRKHQVRETKLRYIQHGGGRVAKPQCFLSKTRRLPHLQLPYSSSPFVRSISRLPLSDLQPKLSNNQ